MKTFFVISLIFLAGGFIFRVIKNTGIGLMVNFWERESNYHWANRDRMFVGGYVTYQF